MIDLAKVLGHIRPGEEWSLNGDDYSGLVWLSDTVKPTEKELVEAWPEVEYQEQVAAVNARRHFAYSAPNGSDAVFMKYQRGEATEQQWLDAVAAINKANPYPVKG